MNMIFSGLTGRELEILNQIHKNGPVTKSDLIEKMNVKLSTLNRAMDTLESRELIFESGISGSTGGRRPVEYDIAHDGVYTVGVDISRTYTEAAVMNLKNQVCQKCRFNMDDSVTPQKCVDRIGDAVERMMSNLAIDQNAVIGIGVGTVGPMNRESGTLLHPQGFPNPEWDSDVPIAELLGARTGIACAIDNGANAAAMLEYYFGAGRGSRCIVYLHCGVGIRTAVIRDGVIIRTMNDAEDAFAQMAININGECLENYVSLEAIRARYGQKTARSAPYEELFRLASGHDDAAVEAFENGARILGMGISNLAKLLNPDLVILSGPLITKNESYYTNCLKAFHEHSTPNHTTAFSKEGVFKQDVVAAGAGLMLVEQNLKLTGRNQ